MTARYLGHQSVSMKPAQDATYFCALSLRVIGQVSQLRGPFQAGAQVGIRYPVEMMLTGHHGLEQVHVVPGERVERAHPAARRSLLSCGQRIELLDGRRRVVNDRQSFQVSGVGLPGDFQVAD